MTMIDDNPKLARRLTAQISMKRAALAYLEEHMTDDAPPSDLLKRHDRLMYELAALEDLMR